MYKYVVGVSQNGREAYINIISSAAGRYFSRQPYLFHIVKDILEPLKLTKPVVRLSHDMGRKIGNTNIVVTKDSDAVYYARQPKQSSMLRFVKNHSMVQSSELAVILERDKNGNYEITNVWIGPLCPPFPDAEDATPESKDYWQTHALVAGSETIDLQTVTRERPY